MMNDIEQAFCSACGELVVMQRQTSDGLPIACIARHFNNRGSDQSPCRGSGRPPLKRIVEISFVRRMRRFIQP